jgi:GntR family transcriptional regulator, transcriptional repressor for pyruvate dehydrogenase complex
MCRLLVVADAPGPESIFPRRSAATDAAEKIKALITDGQLVAGARLPPERDLCLRLSVSRPTLREAIRSLGTMGVLQSRQGAGTYVTDLASLTLAEPLRFMIGLNSRSLIELADVRRLLESGAAELAAREITPEELSDLHGVIDALHVEPLHPGEFIDLDTRFHRVIHIAARNGLLLALLDGMSGLADRSREITGRQPGLLAGTIRSHTAIYDALLVGDPVAARRAMLEHLDEIREALVQILAQEAQARVEP